MPGGTVPLNEYNAQELEPTKADASRHVRRGRLKMDATFPYKKNQALPHVTGDMRQNENGYRTIPVHAAGRVRQMEQASTKRSPKPPERARCHCTSDRAGRDYRQVDTREPRQGGQEDRGPLRLLQGGTGREMYLCDRAEGMHSLPAQESERDPFVVAPQILQRLEVLNQVREVREYFSKATVMEWMTLTHSTGDLKPRRLPTAAR